MTEDALPHGTTPETSFESQYNRVFEAAGCRTQTQLAAVLEVRQSSISDAKRRQSIPPDWLIKLFAKKRVSPEWIRMGTGAQYLQPPDAMPHVAKTVEIRPPAECSAQGLLNELVRRALRPPDMETEQKETAPSWMPVKERGAKL